MLHEPKYMCLEDQVPPFQKERDKPEKGSTKVKKLSKLDMKQILCMEISRLRLFSAERRPLREHMIRGMEGMDRDLFILPPPYLLRELGVIKRSLNYPPPA